MSASWYDVLGVENDATTDEIRAAWQEAIVGLGPTHKRFALYNEAAAVLLDEEQRADYDASLNEGETSDAGEAEPEISEEPELSEEPADEQPAAKAAATKTAAKKTPAAKAPAEKAASEQTAATRSSGLPLVPTWLIIGLALATIVVAGVAFFQHRDQDDTRAEADAVAEAVTAARNAAPKILSYSADTAERDRAATLKVLTGDLKCEYDTLWEDRLGKLLKGSKAFAKTTVAAAAVSDVTGNGERVEVLLVLDTESGSARTQQQMVTLSFTATMVEKDGDWLVEKFDGWDPEAVAKTSTSGKSTDSPTDSPSAEPKSGACS